MTTGKKVRKGADAGGYSRAEYAGRPVNFKTGAQRLTGMTAKRAAPVIGAALWRSIS
ncbi:hypothetical protein J2S94_001045 [Arthrobacter bambusae]|nr:hypothetical protein [Arthrobacter bambusae]